MGARGHSKGEEDHAEAFTAGEGYEVAGFSFSRVSQETRHLDREEKGSGATNANSFHSVRESAVRGKEAGKSLTSLTMAGSVARASSSWMSRASSLM